MPTAKPAGAPKTAELFSALSLSPFRRTSASTKSSKTCVMCLSVSLRELYA